MGATKTLVLAHGQFLLPGVWKKVVWGNPKEELLGVIPKALQLADREGAAVYLCSGIPPIGGRAVSPHALEFALERVNELAAVMEPASAGNILKEAIFDSTVQNTRDEAEHAVAYCRKHNIRRVWVVSAPQHVFRCHQEMLIAIGSCRDVEVCATASDVDFPETSSATAIIVESPHRSDMPRFNTPLYVRAMFQIMKNPERFKEFLTHLGELLARHGVPVDWEPEK